MNTKDWLESLDARITKLEKAAKKKTANKTANKQPATDPKKPDSAQQKG